jgi:hypothetical protein
MAEYDFSALTDKEFEELVRDLLSKDLGISLRTFKKGKDKGIDVRYSSPNNINKVVVQAKHNTETGFKGLINNLKKEIPKVAKLSPGRYIIATSVKLLPQHENEIVKLFSPYLVDANDIYSRERLSRLLSDNKLIEQKYFKVWITSASIFQRIINNSIRGSSEFYEDKIRRNINRYVENKSLKTAIQILKKQKYVLITGQPGVGKTTLSDMIIYSFLAKEFELVYAGKDIKAAEHLMDINPNGKQIFYLDDFLGANYNDILNPKSSDNAIVNFVERIQLSKNRYLILTTRTTILNAARQNYEKFNRANMDIARKELELKDYSDLDKAKILYNHIFHSKIAVEYLNQIFIDKNYFKIIKHKNYNPRIIETITDAGKFGISGQKDYFKFVFGALDNPSEIWKHSYHKQIIEDDRLLLSTLFTFGAAVQEQVLECAFNHRIEYEIKHSGFSKPLSIYNNSLGRLLDGHLTRLKVTESVFTISFVNPSIGDFFIHHLLESADDRKRILFSIIYLEQLEQFYTSVLKRVFTDDKNKSEGRVFFNWLKDVKLVSMTAFDGFKSELNICRFLSIISRIQEVNGLADDIDEMICSKLFTFPFYLMDGNSSYYDFMMPVLEDRKKGGKAETYIKANWEKIIKSMWDSAGYGYELERIVQLFSDYDVDYNEYLLISPNRELVKRVVTAIAGDKIADEVSDQAHELYSDDDVINLSGSLEDLWNEFHELVEIKPDKFDARKYLKDIGEENFAENLSNKSNDSIKEIENIFKFKTPKSRNFDKAIELLFEK